MKKLLLALALVLCITTAKADGFGIGLGPKFGYQTTSLSLKKADIEKSFKNSWTAGVFVRMHIGNFVIQPELMYFKSEKIFNYEGFDIEDFNPTITLNQQNLSLPIFLGYQFDGGLLKLRANAGPVMYFLIGQNQDNNTGIINVENIETQKLTWGAALNVGIDVWRFTLDVNYSLGLTKLFKTDSFNFLGNEVNLEDTKQNIFMVTLGFRLLD